MIAASGSYRPLYSAIYQRHGGGRHYGVTEYKKDTFEYIRVNTGILVPWDFPGIIFKEISDRLIVDKYAQKPVTFMPNLIS